MKIKNLADENFAEKIVLMRVDFNVPIKNNVITDDTRIALSLPTLKYLLEKGAKKIHILAHLGRPQVGNFEEEFSLKIVAEKLAELLNEKVGFAPNFDDNLDKKIILHENIRFYDGEKKNDEKFANEILEKTKAEIFVNDGFGVSHRSHTSVVGFGDKIPCVSGFLISKEIETLSPLLSNEKKDGLTILIGGAKIKTKVKILKHFAKTASNICIGGALANTFLVAKGFDVGESLYEKEEIETVRAVLAVAEQYKTGIHLPIDVICAESFEASAMNFPIRDVMGNLKIFDIGNHTIQSYEEILLHSNTVIWNGPMGLYEYDNFKNGTRNLVNFLAKHTEIKSILGGGDTLDAIKKFGISHNHFFHMSTGGGAMLEFLSGEKLPGIEVLKK